MDRLLCYGLMIMLIGASSLIANGASARDYMRIVGSSTVFPFAITVAERFGQESGFKTPVIEATGSGGGLKLFCAGVGENTPDIANASRPIKDTEYNTCKDNGVSIIEVKIGFDGIVIANSKQATKIALTTKQLFTALAKKVLVDGRLQDNPHKKWSDIDSALPNIDIEILGPPPTSGTRDAFEELVMEKGCKLAGVAKKAKATCTAIREDGAYIESGENDNLIVQKLIANPSALGIFGYSFLEQNAATIRAVSIDGVLPEFKAIADGSYPIARSLFFYIKKPHIGIIPGIMEYVDEFTSEDTWGDEGYLGDKGMIPLPKDQRDEVRAKALALDEMTK